MERIEQSQNFKWDSSRDATDNRRCADDGTDLMESSSVFGKRLRWRGHISTKQARGGPLMVAFLCAVFIRCAVFLRMSSPATCSRPLGRPASVGLALFSPSLSNFFFYLCCLISHFSYIFFNKKLLGLS